MRALKSALPLLLLAGACAVFHPQSNAEKEKLSLAINAHQHALPIYNGRCRPVSPSWTLTYCRSFYAELKNAEIAVAAALSAAEVHDMPQQLADLDRAIHNLSRYEEGPPR